jgi:hypothetical protein
MLDNLKKHLEHLKQGRTGRFLFSQFTHTMITLSVLALLLVGTRQVGALNRVLAPNVQDVGGSATTINYQGRLSDEGGTPLDGQYDLKFAIYDAAEDGAMIWPTDGEPELHEDVTVSEGLFSVGLGSRTTGGVPTSVWSGDRYLQVWVESEQLAPRELLRSVPIAGMALTVPDGAITNEKMALSYWAVNIDSDTDVTSTSSSSPDEITSLDVELPVDGLYLIFAKVLSHANGADQQLIAEVWDENGIIDEARAFNTHSQAYSAGRQTGTIVKVAPFSAGTHTIRLMAYMRTSGSEGAVRGATEMIVIPLGQP